MGGVVKDIQEADQKQVLEALNHSLQRARKGDEELRVAFRTLGVNVDKVRGEASEDLLNRLLKAGSEIGEDVEGEALARAILGDIDTLR